MTYQRDSLAADTLKPKCAYNTKCCVCPEEPNPREREPKSRPVQIETLKKLQNCADSPSQISKDEGSRSAWGGQTWTRTEVDVDEDVDEVEHEDRDRKRDTEETKEAETGESQLSVAWVPVSDVNLTWIIV